MGPGQTRNLEAIFPNGYTFYPDTGKMIPLSFYGIFFKEYADRPMKAYREMIGAFKFHRQQTREKNGTPDESSLEEALKEFDVFLERGRRRNIFPGWWMADHEAELLRLAREDDLLRVDRPFNLEDWLEGKPVTPVSTSGLAMIAERVYWEQSEADTAPSTSAGDEA